jgi:hypothetical protein
MRIPVSMVRVLWSQIVDHVEDAAEQVTRDRHLGHLEDRVAGVGNHLRSGLHHPSVNRRRGIDEIACPTGIVLEAGKLVEAGTISAPSRGRG